MNGYLQIYTDGSCLGNGSKETNSGAWAFYIPALEFELSKSVTNTTNNRMELTAALEALKYAAAKGYISIEILSDSKYVVNGLNNNLVANKDLWRQVIELVSSLNIKWTWVAGHKNNKENIYVDQLAHSTALKLKQEGA